MKFKTGDKVSFLNEKGAGVIIHILSNFRVLVRNDEGFEVSIAADQLVPVLDNSNYHTPSAQDRKWMEQKEEQDIKPPKPETDEAWEVDLHLHELLESYRQKSDHQKLLFQLDYFRRCMDAAIVYRVRKVIFIHGVGKGTLKQEILHALKDYDNIRHFEAPFKKYGFGALVVEFGLLQLPQRDRG